MRRRGIPLSTGTQYVVSYMDDAAGTGVGSLLFSCGNSCSIFIFTAWATIFSTLSRILDSRSRFNWIWMLMFAPSSFSSFCSSFLGP